MSWLLKEEEFKKQAKTIDKSAKLYTKDNWFCRFMAWFLFIISAGQFKRERFLEDFATTIGNLVFIPKEWSEWSCKTTLIHECRHIRQFRYMGLGIHPMVGLPIAAIVYFLLLFPVLLAFGRLLMEYDADMFECDELLKESSDNCDFVSIMMTNRADSLSSKDYIWAVPNFISKSLYEHGKKVLLKDFV